MGQDAIITYLRNTLPNISKESIQQYKSLTTPISFKKGEVIIEQGIVTNTTFIIKKGLAASFIRQPDGSNFIRSIYKQFELIGSLQSIIHLKKTNAVYKALTDCDTFLIKNSEFKKIKNIEFKELYLKTVENVYLNAENRIAELSAFNATKRYLKLRKDIPNIDNILPQYQIANYLNITPIQLSRIRKKIFS